MLHLRMLNLQAENLITRGNIVCRKLVVLRRFQIMVRLLAQRPHRSKNDSSPCATACCPPDDVGQRYLSFRPSLYKLRVESAKVLGDGFCPWKKH